jgi:hypothetical protein
MSLKGHKRSKTLIKRSKRSRTVRNDHTVQDAQSRNHGHGTFTGRSR